jgi:hypothetical protein
MKIQGFEQSTYRRTFTFHGVRDAAGNHLQVQIVPLPIGWSEPVDKALGGMPRPPVRKVGENAGGPVFRPVEEDPDYLAKRDVYVSTVGTAAIHLALSQDPRIQWETPEEMRASDPKEFYRRIADEIKATGWPQADVSRLAGLINDLEADATSAGVDGSKPDFLSTAGS